MNYYHVRYLNSRWCETFAFGTHCESDKDALECAFAAEQVDSRMIHVRRDKELVYSCLLVRGQWEVSECRDGSQCALSVR